MLSVFFHYVVKKKKKSRKLDNAKGTQLFFSNWPQRNKSISQWRLQSNCFKEAQQATREPRQTTQQIRKYHMNRIISSTETESILKEKKHQREILELIKLIKWKCSGEH